MPESAVPELLLTPLENVILKAKTFDMDAPHVILGLAMEDSIPKMDDVANTILSLKELGALQLTYKDEGYSPIDGDLTFLGRVMSNLPLDVRATRLIGKCGTVEHWSSFKKNIKILYASHRQIATQYFWYIP